MNTIIVDDELWSVDQFKDECESLEDITLIGTFSNPFNAIEFAQNNRVDFAMLDIEMPGMNGIELVKKLREIYPKIIIVFVTAYENYLADFIRLKGDYYVLKPYNREDIEDVISRVKLLSKRLKKRVSITTFGQFEVYVDDKIVSFKGKKEKELFALLVDKKGKSLKTEEAFSMLYEDEPFDHKNATKYRMLWSRLNKFLSENNLSDLIININGNKSFNCDMVECDYYEFLKGDKKAIDSFNYEYMSDYSWGEYTLGELTDKKYEYNKK